MPRTTIEITQATKEKLRASRLSHESNYDETILRLLGDENTEFVTEQEVREIVRDELDTSGSNPDSE